MISSEAHLVGMEKPGIIPFNSALAEILSESLSVFHCRYSLRRVLACWKEFTIQTQEQPPFYAHLYQSNPHRF